MIFNKLKLLLIGFIIGISFVAYSVMAGETSGIRQWIINNNLLYPISVVKQVVIGATSTTTSAKLEVYGDAYVSSTLTTGNINATNVSSTSGLFGNTSTTNAYIYSLNGVNGVFTNAFVNNFTANTVSSTQYYGSNIGSASNPISNIYVRYGAYDYLLVSQYVDNAALTIGSSTIATPTNLIMTNSGGTGTVSLGTDNEFSVDKKWKMTGGASIGTLDGLLWGTSGTVSAVATSSLKINTDDLVEGSNLFYTDVRVGQYIDASTTIQTAFSNANTAYSWGNHAGLYDILGQATSTLASHTATYNHSDFVSSTTQFAGDVTGTVGATIVGDDSHAHTASTISGLGVADFSSSNISQWVNDSGYMTTAFATSTYLNSSYASFVSSTFPTFAYASSTFFTTSSANYWAHTSSTIPKTYTDNIWTFGNTFTNITSTNATTTNLYVSGQTYLSGLFSAVNGLFSGTLGVTGKTTLVNASTTNLSASGWLTVAGKVGIGTASPNGKLDINGAIFVNGSTGNTMVRPAVGTTRIAGEITGYNGSNAAADDGFLRLSAGGGTTASAKTYIDLSGYSTVSDMNENIVFGTNGAQRLIINSSGNVGIGTTTPQTKLQVVNNTYATAANNTTDGSTFGLTSSAGTYGIYARNRGDSAGISGFTYVNQILNGSVGSGMEIYTLGAANLTLGTAATARMTILGSGASAGYVGIGTTGPDRKLDILDASNPQLRLSQADGTAYADLKVDSNGILYLTSHNAVYNALAVGTNDTVKGVLNLYSNGTGSSGGGTLYLYTDADHDTTINYYEIAAYEDDLFIGPGTDLDSLKYDGSANNWLFTGAGNVGIGLNNPSTALSVLGTASSTGLQVNGDGMITGTLGVTGQTTLVNASTTAMTVANRLTAGSLVVSGNSSFSNASTTNLTVSGWQTVNSTAPIYFRDTAIHIASLDDGHLDLTADTSIDLNADNVNFSGNAIISGNIELANGQEILGGTYSIKRTINYNSSGASLILAAVDDGYIVTDVYAKVTETWDGTGTVTIGDGDDPDGYMTNANLGTTATGWKGLELYPGYRGAYLTNSIVYNFAKRRAYSGVDTIDAVVTPGTSTKGSMEVYIVISRLK